MDYKENISPSFLLICNDNFSATAVDGGEYDLIRITNNDSLIMEFQKGKTYKGILLLIELKWDLRGGKKTYRDFCGIQVSKELRAKLLRREPILFLSFAPLSFFLRNRQNDVMTTVGHYFRQLPMLQSNWEIELLDNGLLNNIQLEDIIYNFCNLKGLIGEVFHRLKGEVRALVGQLGIEKGEERISEIIDTRIDEIKNLAKPFSGVEQVLLKIKEQIKIKNKKTIQIFLATEESQILSLIYDNGNNDLKNSVRDKNWGVLLLDDEQESLIELKERLKLWGIKKIHTACNVIDAKEIIKDDDKSGNKITVVISDFRLLDKNDLVYEGLRHQKEQGYDFLTWLAEQDRFNRLIALSGLSKKFLMKSFRKNNIRVNVYSKNDLIGNGLNVFIDDIELFGNEIEEIICNQPMAKLWQVLKPFYIYQRNSKDYHVIEKEISDRAKNILTQVRKIIDCDNQEIRQIHEAIEYGRLTTTLNKKQPSSKDDFEIYKEKMIARRVAYWLINFEALDKQEVASLIQKGKLDRTLLTKNFEKQIYSQIGFTLSDFPRNITVEEKIWFTEYMGISPDDIEEVLSQIGLYFELFLNQFFKENQCRISEILNISNEEPFILHSKKEAKSIINKIYSNLKLDKELKIQFTSGLEDLLLSIKEDIYCEKYFEELRRFADQLKYKI